MGVPYAYVCVDRRVTYAIQRNVTRGLPPSNVFSDDDVEWPSGRPAWRRLLASVQRADSVRVWRLDRLGSTPAEVGVSIAQLWAKGASLRTSVERIDSRTPEGRLVLAPLVLQGGGDADGRPSRPDPHAHDVDYQKVQTVAMLVNVAEWPVDKAGRVVGWSRSTTYRRLAEYGVPTPESIPGRTISIAPRAEAHTAEELLGRLVACAECHGFRRSTRPQFGEPFMGPAVTLDEEHGERSIRIGVVAQPFPAYRGGADDGAAQE
ncbi:recombinase family protein [Georgenia muralis]